MGTPGLDYVDQYWDQGYAVQVEVQDGPRDVPLSECTVNDVNGLRGDNPSGQPLKPAQLGTLYVVVECPSNGLKLMRARANWCNQRRRRPAWRWASL